MEDVIKDLGLDCKGCPALPLRTELHIKNIQRWREYQQSQLEKIGRPKYILLCESFPKDRYVYDLKTSNGESTLREKLKKELYNNTPMTNEEFLIRLVREGIFITDCALCPIFLKKDIARSLPQAERRKAATLCLERHTMPLLTRYPKSPIITIFPWGGGFDKKKLWEITRRIAAMFAYADLHGLKETLGIAEQTTLKENKDRANDLSEDISLGG